MPTNPLLAREMLEKLATEDVDAALRLALPRHTPEKVLARILAFHDGNELVGPPLVGFPMRVDVEEGQDGSEVWKIS